MNKWFSPLPLEVVSERDKYLDRHEELKSLIRTGAWNYQESALKQEWVAFKFLASSQWKIFLACGLVSSALLIFSGGLSGSAENFVFGLLCIAGFSFGAHFIKTGGERYVDHVNKLLAGGFRPATKGNVAKELTWLADLKEKGALSEDDFNKAKAKVLSE